MKRRTPAVRSQRGPWNEWVLWLKLSTAVVLLGCERAGAFTFPAVLGSRALRDAGCELPVQVSEGRGDRSDMGWLCGASGPLFAQSRPDWPRSPTPDDLPDDPAELRRLEEEIREIDRLSQLRSDIDAMPRNKQCPRYRWHQTEKLFDVEIPMPNPCEDEQLWLVVDEEQLQVSVYSDDTFGAIAGRFAGKIDPATSKYRVHQPSNRDDAYLHLELTKKTPPGTYEFWTELLEGEEESPTIRFKGETPLYKWKQDAVNVEVLIPVPDDVTWAGTSLELDSNGGGMSLMFDGDEFPEFGALKGKFKGGIIPRDSSWMLDDFGGQKYLELILKKKRDKKDRTAWWSGVLEGDDKW